MQIRITGQGDSSPSGGPPGDCYCVVYVEDHELFERQGQHLVCRVPITYPQAVLGGDIDVPTLTGRAQVTIPAGSQSGEVIVLRGKGLRDVRNSAVGDLLVQLNIHVPQRVSAEEIALLRKLAEIEKGNVAPERKSFFDKLKNYFTQHEEP